MASSDALAPIAQMLATLSDEAVEPLLYTFDSVVTVSDAAVRATAAQMLRDTAVGCTSAERRERLLRAAGDIAAGQPCASAPPQYTEAVVVPEPAPVESQEVEAEEEEENEDPYMEEPPPKLPHLPVLHFFPGLVVRVGRDFCDVNGRAACEQDLLKLLSMEVSEEDYRLAFLERNLSLTGTIEGHAEILENAGNSWFQPVPTADCLAELAYVIDQRLDEAEADAEDEDDDESLLEGIEELRGEIADCRDWLERDGDRGPVPHGGKLAAEIFGKDDSAAIWCRLLFSALPVCLDETQP